MEVVQSVGKSFQELPIKDTKHLLSSLELIDLHIHGQFSGFKRENDILSFFIIIGTSEART